MSEGKKVVPKLHYFTLPARGEVIKLLFEETGTPYENVYYTYGTGDHKAKLGDKLYFGQLPLLEEGDKRFLQTGSIVRYVAKRVGLFPKDDVDFWRSDMVYEAAMDLTVKTFGYVYYGTVKLEEYFPHVVDQLKRFDRILAENNDGKEFLNKEISYGDFALFQVVDLAWGHLDKNDTIFEHAPRVKAHHHRIAARKNVAAFLTSDRRMTSHKDKKAA